jgi:uncharacterized surface anchored protein
MSARIAVILLAAISVRAQEGTGSVTGAVQDPIGIRFAYLPLKLEVPGGSLLDGKTDDHGVYRFSNLPAGEYILHIRSLGFSFLDVKFGLSSGERKTLSPLELELGKSCNFAPHPMYIRFLAAANATGSLTGILKETSEKDSAPIAGAKITLRCKTGESCGRATTTDSQGLFAFENLAPGTYGLGINNPGFSDSGYQVKAGIETSYSFGLHLTPDEREREPVVCE